MRLHLLLALASSASLSLVAVSGCSSSDANDVPSSDGGVTPDGAEPTPGDDAATPDASPSPDAGPHAPGWDPGFSLPGVAGRLRPQISAMARIANRQIALAGNFEQAGSTPTKFVALWNGDKWLSISSGLTGAIEKMVATPTGELFGTVRDDGGTKLFKWDKTVWTEVKSFDGQVTSIDVAPDGALYVAWNYFSEVDFQAVTNLSKLQGTTWSDVPGAPAGLELVRAVGTKVCIGGQFSSFGGGPGVQCLEGGSWQRKAFGPDADVWRVNDITEYDGDLVIGGQFRLDNETGDAGSIARWDGSTWSLIGGGLEGVGPGLVTDMEVAGNKIYVAGDIRFAGGLQVSHVAMWDVAQGRWSTLNDGIFGVSGGHGLLEPPAKALTVDQGGELYVGGNFSLIGGRNAVGIARWDGMQWNPVDDPKAKRVGTNGGASALAEGPNGEMYVGGAFAMVGGDVAASGVARFENETWSPLGAGLDGQVTTLAVKDAIVYAGGAFTRSGPANVRYVAQWNGATWASVGGGVDGPVNTIVFGPDGHLYAGGDFTEAGGVGANRVARWDGQKWSALGSGFDGSVYALAFDASGKLYAGGMFGASGDAPIKSIAVWNGTSWAQVGEGVEGEWGMGSVRSIVFYDGKLTIGGGFALSGSTAIHSLASWDGNAWSPLGAGVHDGWGGPGEVTSLSVRNKELYVVGGMTQAGPVADDGTGFEVENVAMWNGASWSNLGGGTAEAPDEILVTKNNFWVVGGFTFAGNQGSYNVARFWFSN